MFFLAPSRRRLACRRRLIERQHLPPHESLLLPEKDAFFHDWEGQPTRIREIQSVYDIEIDKERIFRCEIFDISHRLGSSWKKIQQLSL